MKMKLIRDCIGGFLLNAAAVLTVGLVEVALIYLVCWLMGWN